MWSCTPRSVLPLVLPPVLLLVPLALPGQLKLVCDGMPALLMLLLLLPPRALAMLLLLLLQPLLEKLLEEFQGLYPGIQFPPLPPKGELDLDKLKEATYFFS